MPIEIILSYTLVKPHEFTIIIIKDDLKIARGIASLYTVVAKLLVT